MCIALGREAIRSETSLPEGDAQVLRPASRPIRRSRPQSGPRERRFEWACPVFAQGFPRKNFVSRNAYSSPYCPSDSVIHQVRESILEAFKV